MKIVINPDGKFLHYEISDQHLHNKITSILSFREIPSTVMYPISKYAPIGQYDIFTITLEVSHEGIKTPLMIGPKTFIAPLAVPLIDDFADYLYAIANTIEDQDRWEQYKNHKKLEEKVLEKGFTFDTIEGVLPQSLFKYERKYFENLDELYENAMIFSSILSSNADIIDDYFEALNEKVFTLETDVFINKYKESIDADVVYEYPKFTVPVSMNGWIIYATLGYEDYGEKIRQMFRITPLVYAPIDFEIMLTNIKQIEKDLVKTKRMVESADDFYNPIKDSAMELIDEFIGYYKELSSIALESEDLKMFDPKNKIKQDLTEYLQKTDEGYEIVVKCGGACTQKEVKKAEEFIKLIKEKSTKITFISNF